jgi:1-acyl-sn-glycerol-3-phosphate acyltransferase
MGDAESSMDILLAMAQQLALELHPHKSASLSVTLDSSLERELGLDSLGRMELLLRLERTVHVRLPEQLIATADTLRDLLQALQGASSLSVPAVMDHVRHQTSLQPQELPEHATTLLAVLDWHVQHHPQRPHVHLYSNDDAVDVLTYATLAQGAQAIAAGLQAQGLVPGQTVALMLPTSQDFFFSFFGILLAGGTPVPIYPPARRSQLEEHIRRQASILANSCAALLITVPEAQSLARLLRVQVPGLRRVMTTSDLAASGTTYNPPTVQAHDVAFVQYTSGSTGVPKGVMLTHANLLANIRAMQAVARTTPADVFVSWLPLYHDMGLIGAWLGSLYCTYPLVLLSPLAFLARPARWLWAIHRHHGTISGAPNFAYELCAQKLADSDLQGLDLSSWRLAFNGAESISATTIERFSARFRQYGFRPTAIAPVYGLAENSLGLAFPPLDRGPRVDRIKREPFLRTGQAVPADPGDTQALDFVSCGYPLPEHQIRLVDALGHEVAERQQGRLEFCGPSATNGYLHNPEETRRLFHGEWLDSGDLAYIAAGEVYITGRVKDMIIRAGRNLYPHELEEAVGNLPGIRKGCVAVFGSPDPVTKTERLVVLAETRETVPHVQATLRHDIDTLVVDRLGIPPDDVVLAPPHTVLKTSSGKLRRAASRELYERGKLGTQPTAVWWQVVRLVAASVGPQLRRLQYAVGNLGYTAYVWMLFGLLGSIAWGAVISLPKRSWRQAVVHTLARCSLRLAGIRLLIQGLEYVPGKQPYVLVVNHASYLDAFILPAVFAGDLAYVAKQELAEQPLIRLPLQRFGVEFVERFAVQRGVEDTSRIVKVVHDGRAVVFFPEGTFVREPGLRSFRLGAFIVACQANVPLVPVTLRGTRSILRANQWFFRRGTVRVIISPPLLPSGADWTAALRLRDAARTQILHDCGEPDLVAAASPLLALQPRQE